MILLNLLNENTFQLNVYSHIKIYYIIFCVPDSPAGMVHNTKLRRFLHLHLSNENSLLIINI